MAEVLGRVLPIVAATVGVDDGRSRELFVGGVVQAHQVDAVHLAHGRFVADAKRAHAAVFAKVVVVFLGVEEVLGQISLARQQTKILWHGHGGPEAGAAADGAVAAVGVLGEV